MPLMHLGSALKRPDCALLKMIKIVCIFHAPLGIFHERMVFRCFVRDNARTRIPLPARLVSGILERPANGKKDLMIVQGPIEVFEKLARQDHHVGIERQCIFGKDPAIGKGLIDCMASRKWPMKSVNVDAHIAGPPHLGCQFVEVDIG